MSPDDFDKVRPAFEAAAHALGWQRRYREQWFNGVSYGGPGPQDWYWVDRTDQHLFDEAALTEGLAAWVVAHHKVLLLTGWTDTPLPSPQEG